MVKKPVRSLSGIAVIAVMAPAFECPGKCLYCFRGPQAAQSYTGLEPAARRAIANKYDPYLMTRNRIEQLERNGHPTEKLEIIVMGGTFNFFPKEFQERFVKRIFDACNEVDARSLEEAHRINENAPHRIIGLTFETRPDWATIPELNWFLKLGATRIELGIQTIYDDVLELVRRGHRVKESIRATRDAKDLGYKVNYHIMPGLPGSSMKRDYSIFKEIFFREDFRPDMLKIYPTLVIPGSELENLYKRGLFNPITTKQAVELLSRVKPLIPVWVRIMRIQRDVPIPAIEAGVDKGNLRELVWKEMERMGKKCRCIRCREVRTEKDIKLSLAERRYKASGAWEVFLSWEDLEKDKIVGFLRLRLLKRFLRPELENSAIVRELRIYGPQARIGEKGLWQHKGLGRKLMEKAEEIALEEGYEKLAVISGVGVRGYFRKLGYELEGVYMVKDLKGF